MEDNYTTLATQEDNRFPSISRRLSIFPLYFAPFFTRTETSFQSSPVTAPARFGRRTLRSADSWPSDLSSPRRPGPAIHSPPPPSLRLPGPLLMSTPPCIICSPGLVCINHQREFSAPRRSPGGLGVGGECT